MKKYLLSAALLFSSCACQPVFACSSVSFALFSYHWDRSALHNEVNYGLGCEDVYDKWDITYFKNSNWKHSVMVSDYKVVKTVGRFSFGYDYGIVTGYDWPVMPAILPKMTVDLASFKITGYILLTEGVAFGLSKKF